MGQRRKKRIYITTAILIVLAIILAVCLLNKKAPESMQQAALLNEPIDLGSGLKLTELLEVTGNFPEDGSDEFVENMLSATFVNEGENTIQYSSVQVTVGEENYTFAFSTLPAGEAIRVFEADKKELLKSENEVSAEAEAIAYFQEEPSLYEDELELAVSDGIISVKNISGTDIDKEISIFYKNVSGDTYIGGITYRLRVPAGLAAGEEYKGNAMHASEKMSKVMFVTYGE